MAKDYFSSQSNAKSGYSSCAGWWLRFAWPLCPDMKTIGTLKCLWASVYPRSSLLDHHCHHSSPKTWVGDRRRLGSCWSDVFDHYSFRQWWRRPIYPPYSPQDASEFLDLILHCTVAATSLVATSAPNWTPRHFELAVASYCYHDVNDY